MTDPRLDPAAAALLASLEEAAQGLSFPSEADRPIAPFVLAAAGEPTPEAVCVAAGLCEGARVEELSVRELFDPVVESAGAAEADRLRALVALLEGALEGARAYRVGEVELRLFAIGRHASGAWIGVETSAVET
jgi:hypothetical protein